MYLSLERFKLTVLCKKRAVDKLNLNFKVVSIALTSYNELIVGRDLRYADKCAFYLRREDVYASDFKHIVASSDYLVHTCRRSSASARLIVDICYILCSVTDKRNSFFLDTGNYKLTLLTCGKYLSRFGIDYFGKIAKGLSEIIAVDEKTLYEKMKNATLYKNINGENDSVVIVFDLQFFAASVTPPNAEANMMTFEKDSLEGGNLNGAFQKANDMELPYVFGPRRDGDLAAFWADAEKAKTLLGWEATHTVEDMCRSAWTFAKNAGSQE